MLFILLILTYFTATGLSVSVDFIKVDKSFIELRLVQDVILESSHHHQTYPWRFMKSVHISRSLDKGIEIFQLEEYKAQLPAILIVHGFRGCAEKHNPHLYAFIRNNFHEKFNLLILDMRFYLGWSKENFLYLLPAIRAKLIGEAVGQLLNEAIEKGFITAEKINMLGFSLGAQISGYIARTVQGKINSILGLDPAGPGFDNKLQDNLAMKHLSKADARIVHAYHTDMNSFGSSQRIATADFVFNNGWYQPGCMSEDDGVNADGRHFKSKYQVLDDMLICNHRRALIYFVSIVNQPELFLARRCDSYWDFKHCHCKDNEIINLTFPLNVKANGTYYLTTAANATWGEGLLGTMCPHDRMMKLISAGVMKPTPTLYEKLISYRSRLYWGSWRKGNTTVVNYSTSSETSHVENSLTVTSNIGVLKLGNLTITSTIDIDMTESENSTNINGTSTSENITGIIESAERTSFSATGEPKSGNNTANGTATFENNSDTEPFKLSNAFTKNAANVLPKSAYTSVTNLGKYTKSFGISFPQLIMKFPWMMRNQS